MRTSLFAISMIVGAGTIAVAAPAPKAELPKAGEERAFEVADGLKMLFCWIPPGECQLGSPKEERGEVLKTIKEEKEPAWLVAESEGVRKKYKGSGFWLAKYPVTQGEYSALLKANPSQNVPSFAPIKRANIMDTSKHPVEHVSWTDCKLFLAKLNAKGGTGKVFGNEGKFVLPHEDAWEYAYRGGNGGLQAYYWGNKLNGEKANCNGGSPFGDIETGPNLKRSTEVGSFEKAAPHPWGLCDMSGNVWQWCDNWYGSDEKGRVLRGGSWFATAQELRGAYRRGLAPDKNDGSFGLRVMFRPE